MKYFFISIFLLTLIFFSCKNNNKHTIDVSDIEVNIKTKHFEKDLFKFNVDSSNYYLTLYKQKYGEFFKLFNYQVVEMGSSEDKNYPENLDLYIRYWQIEEIPKILAEEFLNFEQEQFPEIEEAFKHYKYYFPENYIPELYTFFSSFGYSVVTLDSIIGLGIDKYLGKKYFHLYDKVGWSSYQKRRMHKEMIPVDIMRSMAESDYPYEATESDNLLDNMIYEGKVQYYLNCMLPKVPDTLKWRYTGKQLAWANKHENKIWGYIAEQKLLFSTDKTETGKFVGDGPYTSIFTDVSAPRAGAYVGFKIVDAYMENNKEITLKQLMEEKESRMILAKAKYNP